MAQQARGVLHQDGAFCLLAVLINIEAKQAILARAVFDALPQHGYPQRSQLKKSPMINHAKLMRTGIIRTCFGVA
jgi:hypothetical protein